MKRSFWKKIEKPIACLAPMADVTDAAFRKVIAKYGKPDIIWTEFVSADGLCSAGRERLMHNLIFSKGERPIVAQIFGSKLENMKRAAKIVAGLGFDGIDINMGCPDRKVEKQNAGAFLIKTPKLAREIIKAVKDGAGDLPVSVKTRIGYNKNELSKWLPEILAEEPEAVILHLRTRKEMSLVPARWENLKFAVEIRDKMNSDALIIGNGDVDSVEKGIDLAERAGADGFMVGRGTFGNPWFFAGLEKRKKGSSKVGKTPPQKKRLKVLCEHTDYFEKILGKQKNFSVMKKHFKSYVSGFDGAKELRAKLMECNNASQTSAVIEGFQKEYF